MQKLYTVKYLSVIIILLFSSFTCSQNKENRAVKIADSFIELHPDSIAYKSEAKSYKWNYEQGLMMEAFYRLWKHTGDEKYMNYILKNINYYVEDDGSIKTYKMDDFNIDNVSPGRILLHVYKFTREEKYRKAADTLRKQLTLHPRTKTGGFWHKKIYPNQMWLDGLFMAEPFYAMYSAEFERQEDFDDITRQFLLIEEHLKDEKTGLYYHGWDESRQQKWADPLTGRSPNYWGRAIGWFMMALTDVLDYIPERHKNRADLLNMYRELAEALLKYRDKKTGLWYQVVDKGDSAGNYIEASASAMFTYSFARGANKGYLDKKFLAAAEECFESIEKNLVTLKDNNIYLNDVVSVSGLGGNPYRDGSYKYYISEPKRVNDFKGYGPFLLAAMEIKKSAEKTILLDYYFNNEWRKLETDTTVLEQYHYVWEDTTFSGFSELGKTITKMNGVVKSLKQAPAAELLKDADMYIIVDPDTKKETAEPNFIDEKSRRVIAEWVNEGGILLLFANDSGNCEFDNLNQLSREFGITFNRDSKNRVTGQNFHMGKIEDFGQNPVFKGVKSIYLKEISTINIVPPAEVFLSHEGNTVMALSKYGKGYVFAVGDPWLYNEYIDNRKLPEEYENYNAAKNLFKYLLHDLKK